LEQRHLRLSRAPQEADFSGISKEARKCFDILGTSDFEHVMRALRDAASVVKIYGDDNVDLAQQLGADAKSLKEVLVKAIAGSHPEHPDEIKEPQYTACRKFLANFESMYTLNYDLLLYWTLMRKEILPEIPCDDGFRQAAAEPKQYVTWEPENIKQQNVHFLHGSLHIFDGGTEIQKYTWSNTGIRLIAQVRDALERDLYPLFVSEGESDQKLGRIRHSDFLSKASRSFVSIGGTLFIYGHSLDANDEHIIRLIPKSNVKQLFVSIYGDPQSKDNQRVITRANSLPLERKKKTPLDVHFYDAETAQVWGGDEASGQSATKCGRLPHVKFWCN
jgi:hypothetical protein